jgi:hypothetical protein
MNYSIMAHGVAKYGLSALRVGAFMGGCFLSYGFGLMRGEKRVQAEIDWSPSGQTCPEGSPSKKHFSEGLGIVKAGIEIVIDEKRWKEEMNKEMQKQAVNNKSTINEIEKECAHPH